MDRADEPAAGTTQTRVVTKYEKQPTFFDFFSPPKAPADHEDQDDELAGQLEEDFEVLRRGWQDIFISSHANLAWRDHPRAHCSQRRAVVHRRGLPERMHLIARVSDVRQALDYEDDGFNGYEGDDGDDDGEGDDDSDNDPDYKPPAAGAPGQKPECKQS